MKRKISRCITSVVLAAVCTIGIMGCSKKTSKGEDSFSKLKAKGYVVVGLDDTFAPMGFKNEKGEITGFDVDLARETFKRIGLEVKFQPIDWSMKEAELNSSNIDLIWNGYTITDERKEKVAFSKPYLENNQMIITLSGSNISAKNDLKGKKVAVQNGSSSFDAVSKDSKLLAALSGGKLVLFDSNNDAFMDLEAGRVDAVVADEILARYYISQRGSNKYKLLQDTFGSEEYGIGIRKGDKELLDKINSALDDMKKDGACENISKKWFGSNIVK